MYGEGGNRGGFRPRGRSGGESHSGFGGGGAGFAPVKVGEELDVRIEAVGEKGDGIARKRGFVLFVPSTKEGDEVKIRVTKVLRKVGFAEVIGKADAIPQEEPRPARQEEERAQPVQVEEEAHEDSENFGEEQPAEEKSSEEDLDAPPLPEDEEDSGEEEEK